MNTSLVVFNGNGDSSKVTTNKAGCEYTRFFNKKEYGALKGLKGQALNRAHTEYRITRGRDGGNTNVAAMIARGEILIETHRSNKAGTGGTFGYTLATQLAGAPVPTAKQAAAQLTDEELLAIVAARKAPATA